MMAMKMVFSSVGSEGNLAFGGGGTSQFQQSWWIGGGEAASVSTKPVKLPGSHRFMENGNSTIEDNLHLQKKKKRDSTVKIKMFKRSLIRTKKATCFFQCGYICLRTVLEESSI